MQRPLGAAGGGSALIVDRPIARRHLSDADATTTSAAATPTAAADAALMCCVEPSSFSASQQHHPAPTQPQQQQQHVPADCLISHSGSRSLNPSPQLSPRPLQRCGSLSSLLDPNIELLPNFSAFDVQDVLGCAAREQADQQLDGGRASGGCLGGNINGGGAIDIREI